MGRLFDAHRKEISHVPALVLRAFAIVFAVTKAYRSASFKEVRFNPLDMRPDRLPMGVMAEGIEVLRDKPLTSLWHNVIESWIIAQHVHWSAVRETDGKKRLRIGLEGQGWIRVRSTEHRLPGNAGPVGYATFSWFRMWFICPKQQR